MPENPLPEVRQLRKILQEKVLPFVENGSPIILFDDPPRCLTPFEVQEYSMPALPEVLSDVAYPHVQKWREQRLKSQLKQPARFSFVMVKRIIE